MHIHTPTKYTFHGHRCNAGFESMQDSSTTACVDIGQVCVCCVCTCVYMSIYVCMHIYYVHRCMTTLPTRVSHCVNNSCMHTSHGMRHVCVCVSVCVCVCVCLCVCVRVCVCVCVYATYITHMDMLYSKTTYSMS